MASCGPTPERRSLDCRGRASVCRDRPERQRPGLRPRRGALARRFARRVLAFDEVHWLGFDPDRATATLNFRLANGDPGMLLTRLAGAVAPCAAEVKEIELPDWTDGEPCTLYRHSSVVSIFPELSIGNGCLMARHPASWAPKTPRVRTPGRLPRGRGAGSFSCPIRQLRRCPNGARPAQAL